MLHAPSEYGWGLKQRGGAAQQEALTCTEVMTFAHDPSLAP